MQNIQVIHQNDYYTIYVDDSFWSTAESWREVEEELEHIRSLSQDNMI